VCVDGPRAGAGQAAEVAGRAAADPERGGGGGGGCAGHLPAAATGRRGGGCESAGIHGSEHSSLAIQ
jgi:hypothetical protein